MSGISVAGWGAVSPAGWGVRPLREVCQTGTVLPVGTLDHPGLARPLHVRRVPSPNPRPAFMAHPRLRRTSAISQHTTAAAIEALGRTTEQNSFIRNRLGILFTAMTGCVNYSRRFFAEVLQDPTTASPIVFPETVFNAPASHLATFLETNTINYTLVGDPSTFVQALALAADWLIERRVDTCLVVGAEELAWPVAGAERLFDRSVITSDGAGALLLMRTEDTPSSVRLDAITNPIPYTQGTDRHNAARRLRQAFAKSDSHTLLCDSLTGSMRTDEPEVAAWADWTKPRVSVKKLLGESFAAASAWQCVTAVDSLARGVCTRALVNVLGCNQQAIGAQFVTA